MRITRLLSLATCLLAASTFAKPPEFLDSGKVYPPKVPLAEAVRIDKTLLL